MLVLGIETSCDETSVAVVKNGQRVLSNIVYSQIDLHRKTGGVVPEVAAREHAVRMIPVLEEALKKAKIKLSDIDAIAVTKGPGLQTSLLAGVNCANALALVLEKPLVGVNHIEGHMYANFLHRDEKKAWGFHNITSFLESPERGSCGPRAEATKGRGASPSEARRASGGTVGSPRVSVKFPVLVLTASGGHNELILWLDHGKYRFLGSTLDDAAGEAFDKVARMLGLPYPGGPQIEKLAARGNSRKFKIPLPYPQTLDFSFSGIKTAVLYLIRDLTKNGKRKLTMQQKADIAAGFQNAVTTVLAKKIAAAEKKFRVKEIHLAGGVSANSFLRKKVHEMFDGAVFRYPQLSFCTDNAAMIAACGYYQFKKNPKKYKIWKPIISDPSLKIRNW